MANLNELEGQFTAVVQTTENVGFWGITLLDRIRNHGEICLRDKNSKRGYFLLAVLDLRLAHGYDVGAGIMVDLAALLEKEDAMPRDSELERKVRSDEFEDMAHSLSAQVGLLLKRASKGPFAPPLYLAIADADHKTVLETLVDFDGLELRSNLHAPVRTRYPLRRRTKVGLPSQAVA